MGSQDAHRNDEPLLDASIDKQKVRNALDGLGIPRGTIRVTGLTDGHLRTTVIITVDGRDVCWALLDDIRKPLPDFLDE